MPKCIFCDANMEAGTGKMFVQKTGKIFWFCTKKCEKNMMKLGRDARKFKWTGKREKKIAVKSDK